MIKKESDLSYNKFGEPHLEHATELATPTSEYKPKMEPPPTNLTQQPTSMKILRHLILSKSVLSEAYAARHGHTRIVLSCRYFVLMSFLLIGPSGGLFRYDSNNYHMLVITLMSHHITWNHYFCSY